MPPCPTSEQFLPPAHAYDVRSCKGNPPSRLAALACYTVTGSMYVDRHAPGGRGAVRRRRVNYRYYNPTDGRWTMRDPLGEITGLNIYDYVHNRPSKHSDYAGQFIDTIWDVANVVWDAGKFVIGAIIGDAEMRNEGASDFLLDTAAVFIPGVPAGASKVARVAKKTAAKAAKQSEKEAARRARKISKCLGYHTIYHEADQKAAQCSQSTCCREFIVKLSAKALEIRYRRIYLKNGCDYYLPGSVAKTPQVAIQSHKGELKRKRSNFSACFEKAILKGCANLPNFAL